MQPHMSEQVDFPIERRAYLRLRYPPEAAPVMVIWGRAFRVIDVCEMGVRFLDPYGLSFREGSVVNAKLTFHNKECYLVSGSVAWTKGNQVALRLVRGIPSRQIQSEQSILRQLEQV